MESLFCFFTSFHFFFSYKKVSSIKNKLMEILTIPTAKQKLQLDVNSICSFVRCIISAVSQTQ